MYCSNCGSELGSTYGLTSTGRRSKAGKHDDRGTEDNTGAGVGEIGDIDSDETEHRMVSPEELSIAESAIRVFIKLVLLAALFLITSLIVYIFGGNTSLHGDLSEGIGIIELFVIAWAISLIISSVFTSDAFTNFAFWTVGLMIFGFLLFLVPTYGPQGNILQPASTVLAAIVAYFLFCVTLASSIIYLRVKKIGGALDSGRLSVSLKHRDRN